MLAIDRYHAIKDILNQSESVSVSELGRSFGVSDETIRRDLDKLSQKEKSIVRVHGGAYMVKTFDQEAPFALRASLLVDQKERIAKRAFSVIEDGDILMLDSSTTTLHLAGLLREAGERKLTVVSNSLDVIQTLSDCPHLKLIGIGGELRTISHSFIGYAATSALCEFRADKAFVSCSGLHERFGITDNSEQEARVRRAMLQNSMQRYMLADSEKFGRFKANRIADLGEIDEILTDEAPEESWNELLKAANVKLEVCMGAELV